MQGLIDKLDEPNGTNTETTLRKRFTVKQGTCKYEKTDGRLQPCSKVPLTGPARTRTDMRDDRQTANAQHVWSREAPGGNATRKGGVMDGLREVDLPHHPARIAPSGVCRSHRTDRGCCGHGGHWALLLLLSMTRCDERRAGAKTTTTIGQSRCGRSVGYSRIRAFG